MMIYLSKLSTDDPGSNVALRNFPEAGEYNSTARIGRDKTLDGGGVFSHHGTSFVDRDFEVECRVTAAEGQTLKIFHEEGVLIRISFWEGVFNGYIFRLNIQRDGAATIIFYFKEKLA